MNQKLDKAAIYAILCCTFGIVSVIICFTDIFNLNIFLLPVCSIASIILKKLHSNTGDRSSSSLWFTRIGVGCSIYTLYHFTRAFIASLALISIVYS